MSSPGSQGRSHSAPCNFEIERLRERMALARHDQQRHRHDFSPPDEIGPLHVRATRGYRKIGVSVAQRTERGGQRQFAEGNRRIGIPRAKLRERLR
jgi:hypothetical protein